MKLDFSCFIKSIFQNLNHYSDIAVHFLFWSFWSNHKSKTHLAHLHEPPTCLLLSSHLCSERTLCKHFTDLQSEFKVRKTPNAVRAAVLLVGSLRPVLLHKEESSADLCCDDRASIKGTTSCEVVCLDVAFQPITEQRPLFEEDRVWPRREKTVRSRHSAAPFDFYFSFPSSWEPIRAWRSRRSAAARKPVSALKLLVMASPAADELHVISVPLQGKGRGNGGSCHTRCWRNEPVCCPGKKETFSAKDVF